jgi:hypothetical protein
VVVFCPLVRRDGGPPRRVAKLYLRQVEIISGAARATGSHGSRPNLASILQESEKSENIPRQIGSHLGNPGLDKKVILLKLADRRLTLRHWG